MGRVTILYGEVRVSILDYSIIIQINCQINQVIYYLSISTSRLPSGEYIDNIAFKIILNILVILLNIQMEQQNTSFINQPLSPSIIGITQTPNNKYYYYRIPHLHTDSRVEQQKISRVKNINQHDQFSNANSWSNNKTEKRVNSQVDSRDHEDYLPTIKKKSYPSKQYHQSKHFVLKKRGSSYLPGHRTADNCNDNKYSPIIKLIEQPRQEFTNDEIKDYIRKLKRKQLDQNRRYKLITLNRSVPSTKQITKQAVVFNSQPDAKVKSSEAKASRASINDIKTQYQKERRKFYQIYFSFKHQSASKERYFKKIPKIPKKDQLQNFVSNYSPINHQIDIKALLVANFCVVEHSPKHLYIGQMIGKNKNGIGILITQKSCFEGQWKNNQKVRGVQMTTNGTYKGTFFYNQRHGNGQYERHNGETYEGQWAGGKKHGNGLWVNNEGQSYKGQWKFGKPFGHGILKLKQRTYQGLFVNFIQEGFGRQSFNNGDTFQGMFKNDLPYGYGTYIWKNGNKFIGNFLYGRRSGKGEMNFKDIVLYKGSFIQDKPVVQYEVQFIDRKYRKKHSTQMCDNSRVSLIKSPIF